MFSKTTITAAVASLILTASTGSQAFAGDDIKLPKGDLNGASSNCQPGSTKATLIKGSKSWDMEVGQRLAFKTKEGDDWDMKCTADGVTISLGTGCFFDGFVIAAFEKDAMRVACYEGNIPEDLHAG